MPIRECKDFNLCECGYIEDEEFELPENWEEIINAKLRQTGHVIAVGNGEEKLTDPHLFAWL